MNCSSSIIGTGIGGCRPDMNQKTQNLSILLSKQERKALKLLSKQYIVESFHMDPVEFQGERIVRENPLVITYFSPEDPSKKFEWKLDPIETKYL
jgi:hypothetical protein